MDDGNYNINDSCDVNGDDDGVVDSNGVNDGADDGWWWLGLC